MACHPYLSVECLECIFLVSIFASIHSNRFLYGTNTLKLPTDDPWWWWWFLLAALLSHFNLVIYWWNPKWQITLICLVQAIERKRVWKILGNNNYGVTPMKHPEWLANYPPLPKIWPLPISTHLPSSYNIETCANQTQKKSVALFLLNHLRWYFITVLLTAVAGFYVSMDVEDVSDTAEIFGPFVCLYTKNAFIIHLSFECCKILCGYLLKHI